MGEKMMFCPQVTNMTVTFIFLASCLSSFFGMVVMSVNNPLDCLTLFLPLFVLLILFIKVNLCVLLFLRHNVTRTL